MHVKVDTGMGRIGIRAEEAPSLIAEIAKMPAHYVREYHIFSQSTHATLMGLIACDFDTNAKMIVPCTIYVDMATIGYASPLTGSDRQMHYEERATEVLSELNRIQK